MYKLFAISYETVNARYAATPEAAGGVLVLQSTDVMAACRTAEQVLSRNTRVNGIREVVYVFAPSDVAMEPPLGRTA